MRHPFLDLPHPLVIGHRGAAGECPENTLPSFELALRSGADVLETDVHATCDGAVVADHDRVDRTTDGRGRIADLPLEALRRLDAGARFTPDGGASHPWRGRGLRIPTLEELFERFPEAHINIEVKAPEPVATTGTLDLVERHARAARTLVTAESPEVMARIRREVRRRALPVAVGACREDVVAFLRSALDHRAPPEGFVALQVPAEFAGRPLVTPEFVAHAHRFGLEVHVWTVNEVAEMERLLDLGVDGLVTDHPGRLFELLRRRGRR